MMLSGRDVLLVGRGFPSAQNLTARLQSWGLQCHFVDDLRSARKRLVDRPVDLVLSDTHRADGTGFSLLSTLVGLSVTTFLCLPVENSCFWLPAIDDGKECLGERALRPGEFASLLEEMTKYLKLENASNGHPTKIKTVCAERVADCEIEKR